MHHMARTGLTADEARRRLSVHSRNVLFVREKVSFLRIARHEVARPVILGDYEAFEKHPYTRA